MTFNQHLTSHEYRESIVKSYVDWLIDNCTKSQLNQILNNPYEPYDDEIVLKLSAFHGIQKRTAKEWLISAQIRLALNYQ